MLKQTTKVSICIPTYNGEKYLKKCLSSCINQTFKDIEIIVVDDQSTDNTIAFVKEYTDKYPFVKLHINQCNLGLVGNWNKCIELSTGEWIKFVFQDDYMEPTCIEQFLNHTTTETMLVVSKRSFILPESITKKYKDYYETEVRTFENVNVAISKGVINAQTISKLFAKNICMNFIAEPSLTLFNKGVVQKVGYFDSELEQICDLDFFLRISSNFGLTYLPEKLCHFRIHASSTTSTNLEVKQYTLSNIDPIVLVYKTLHMPVYSMLRNSLSYFYRWKLKNYLAVRAYEAFRTSFQTTKNEEVFNKLIQKNKVIKDLQKPTFTTLLIYLLVIFRRKLRG